MNFLLKENKVQFKSLFRKWFLFNLIFFFQKKIFFKITLTLFEKVHQICKSPRNLFSLKVISNLSTKKRIINLLFLIKMVSKSFKENKKNFNFLKKDFSILLLFLKNIFNSITIIKNILFLLKGWFYCFKRDFKILYLGKIFTIYFLFLRRFYHLKKIIFLI